MAMIMDDWLWRKGRSIRFWTQSFRTFRGVVTDYDNLDADVKTAALKASSAVVSIISKTGDKFLFGGSGTIIECDEQGFATVLTSATLLRGSDRAPSIPSNIKIELCLSDGKLYEGQVSLYDFHYNIATIKFKSTAPLLPAITRDIDDSVASNLTKHVLVKHSSLFKLFPGERVIALGRNREGDREIMASPGVFSARDCRHDCKELFLTTCVVTKLAVGGPLINVNGEVIGVNFFTCPFNSFIPMNVVSKCLEDLKMNGHVSRPWLGATITNLYSADLEKLDKLYQKFPDETSGVIVEQVIGKRNTGFQNRAEVPKWVVWSPRNWLMARAFLYHKRKIRWWKHVTRGFGESKSRRKRKRKCQSSPASVAGLCAGDIITKCGEVSVNSHHKFVEALWDKEGKALELGLIRPSIGPLTVTLTVGSCPKMPRWIL